MLALFFEKKTEETNESAFYMLHTTNVTQCARERKPITYLLRDPFNQNFRNIRSKTQWIGSV